MHFRSWSTPLCDLARLFRATITHGLRQCSPANISLPCSVFQFFGRRGRTRLLLGSLAILLLGMARGHSAEAAFGPFYHEYHLTLAPGERTEVMGPLFYTEKKESTHLWAVPPVFS